MGQRVAILGLGTMGVGMAKNLLKAGFPLAVYNRTRSKAETLAVRGARIADTPIDAVRDADVILSMVADDKASRLIWTDEEGALNGAKAGAVLIESSTVTPEWIAELNQLATERKLDLLDAPVTGSRVQADVGQLTFLTGGDADVVEQVRTVLAAMSKEVVLLGPIGSGTRMKLINNFLCGVQVASLAEGLTWIEHSGLNREQALTVLKNGAPGSPLIGAISDRMVAAGYEVNFLLSLMAKDLHYAHLDAASLGIDLRTAKIAEARFAEAVDLGFADKDMSAVIEPVRASVSYGSFPGKQRRGVL